MVPRSGSIVDCRRILHTHEPDNPMHFLLIAYDGSDVGAKDRRLAVRAEHFKRAREAAADGTLVVGGAILNDEGEMTGSAVILNCGTREDAEAWIESDPYVAGNVWQSISLHPFLPADL